MAEEEADDTHDSNYGKQSRKELAAKLLLVVVALIERPANNPQFMKNLAFHFEKKTILDFLTNVLPGGPTGAVGSYQTFRFIGKCLELI